MFNEALFQEIFLLSSGNKNDYVTHILKTYAEQENLWLGREKVAQCDLLK